MCVYLIESIRHWMGTNLWNCKCCSTREGKPLKFFFRCSPFPYILPDEGGGRMAATNPIKPKTGCCHLSAACSCLCMCVRVTGLVLPSVNLYRRGFSPIGERRWFRPRNGSRFTFCLIGRYRPPMVWINGWIKCCLMYGLVSEDSWWTINCTHCHFVSMSSHYGSAIGLYGRTCCCLFSPKAAAQSRLAVPNVVVDLPKGRIKTHKINNVITSMIPKAPPRNGPFVCSRRGVLWYIWTPLHAMIRHSF